MALPSHRDPRPRRNERPEEERSRNAHSESPSAANQQQRAGRSYSRNSISYNRSGQARQDRHAGVEAGDSGSIRGSHTRSNRGSRAGADEQPNRQQRNRRETRHGQAPEQGSYRSAQPERYHAQHGSDHYSNRARYLQPKKKTSLVPALVAVLVVAALGVGGYFFVQSLPITVTVNGQSQRIDGAKTIETVLEKKLVIPEPGDLVAVDGSLLEEGKGETITVTHNGTITADYQTKLANGDSVDIGDGADKMEDSKDSVETIPFAITEEGWGPLHVFEGTGVDGQRTTKTGAISGITITEDTAVEDITIRKYFPDVGDDKVIALTFDDGPWPEYTKQILDILNQNKVKATFFVVGENFTGDNPALIKQAHDAGHQISSHSYSHARGDGGSINLGLMPADEQIAEVTKGYETISAAIGTEPSHILRAPGGNFDASCQHTLRPYVDAEIGWSIDTQDWKQPGVEAIVDQMKAARTGDVILLHDGGGNREQTVEAIKEAIPYLKEQGFTFITIDEMLQYPPR